MNIILTIRNVHSPGPSIFVTKNSATDALKRAQVCTRLLVTPAAPRATASPPHQHRVTVPPEPSGATPCACLTGEATCVQHHGGTSPVLHEPKEATVRGTPAFPRWEKTTQARAHARAHCLGEASRTWSVRGTQDPEGQARGKTCPLDFKCLFILPVLSRQNVSMYIKKEQIKNPQILKI